MPTTGLLQLQRLHLEELQQRYSRALEQHGYDALLVSSGAAPMRYADDHAYVFQGYGPFVHWTGLTKVEHSWLLVRPGQRAQLWLYSPVDFWHASAELPTEPWAEQLDIHAVEGREAPPLERLGRVAVLGDPAVLAGSGGELNPPELLASLDAARVHKTAYELGCLDIANARAATGHRAAQQAFLSGGSEFEISLAYQRAAGQREAEAPYHSIIGVNAHAGILHYQYYDTDRPKQPRSLLIDAGYRYRGYGSDITRTTAGLGQGLFQGLIAGIEALQQRLCQAVAPGVDFVDLHRKTHLGLAALLGASGLVTGLDDDVMVAEGVTRAFFPHGLGHLLGVQVHDVGGKPVPPPQDAPFLRLTRTLEPGMVVTIEPGLYFIPSLLEPVLNGPLGQYLNLGMIDELSGCGGIRIEDNVEVTETGNRNLTRRHLP